MAEKILLVNDDPQSLQLTTEMLTAKGYEVVTARNGNEGLKKAQEARPNLVILDIMLPGMDGNEVCRHLRTHPKTANLPIIMLTSDAQLGDQVIGSETSADDYLIKPVSLPALVDSIKTLISGKEKRRDSNLEEARRLVVSTGSIELDNKMGGGIPLGSLTLIEGDSSAGKSVLTQQMIHGSLQDGYRISLFTSENTVKSLVKQMQSLQLDILDFLLLDKFRVYSMEVARLRKEAPQILLQAMKREMDRDMIFVDSLTSVIIHSRVDEVLGYFEECKRLCSQGTTIIVVLHSHALSVELLTRIQSLCDAHLRLRTEEVGNKLLKTMEVSKVRGAEQTTGNIVSFEVEPGWGMRIIPLSRARG